MTDFEHTMQRRDGRQMAISVKADALTLTINPPITANEKEAMSGLKSLAAALKRDVDGSDIQVKDGAISLAINTPSGRDNALAMVAVSSLETHDVLKTGESKKFETALHNSEQTQVQQAVSDQTMSAMQKAATAIGDALKGIVKADSIATPSKVFHVAEIEIPEPGGKRLA